ncbi:MAG: SNF2-related protein [Phycisphaerales bacterium]
MLRGAPNGRARPDSAPPEHGTLDLKLPVDLEADRPAPSTRLAHAAGHVALLEGAPPALGRSRVPTLKLTALQAAALLEAAEGPGSAVLNFGPSIAFFASASRLASYLLVQQRFVPSLRQEPGGALHGLWQPWLADERTAIRAAALLGTMPPVVRAAVDEFDHQPWPILESFVTALVDTECRRVLTNETMADAIASRDGATDAHVAWLSGLLAGPDDVQVRPAQRPEMVKLVRRWIGGLEDRGASSAWRLLLRLEEPDEPPPAAGGRDDSAESAAWGLTFALQSQDNARVVLDAEDVWLLPTESVTIEGRRADRPGELLVAELTRAARLYPTLDRVLDDAQPSGLELDTRKAYHFLREIRPILLEQGFGVEVPGWWDEPAARLGARLKLTSDEHGPSPAPTLSGPGLVASARASIGLDALVNYAWEISVGGTTLTLQEFEKLAARRVPLVRLHGRWVEIRPEDVEAAVKFIRENPGGAMKVGDAVRLAYGAALRATGIPIVGLEATGWVSAFFGATANNERIPMIEAPAGFHGSLRPYQLRGLAWLVFLERFGFGPCLADDMGLGKTIQLLALLAHEREQAARDRAAQAIDSRGVPPTLIVVPLSVVGNWLHEAKRFCPQLKVLVHHGVERLTADAFVTAAEAADAVVTTYALVHRDRDTLAKVHWHRVVLDEAQIIKNPTTKQAMAVRSLTATSRACLTGTPVENRLSELWSIMDFLNPGYLGTPGMFRSRFAVPVERYRDPHRAEQLRELIRPFLLRRHKTDPAVAADLPEKVESREYAHLTSEQAELYEQVVRRMLGQVDQAQGMRRRGLVLASLVKLKQVCNHPSQFLKDHDSSSPTPPSPARSGKCQRLVQMLEEVLAGGEQALIFTQFRQMALLLAPMLRHDLDREALVFHGGTTQAERDAIVRRFQLADGTAPILIVSLKAGGVGLNLTAATHVFHFDRWWNPAVENQATDRAFRIGQTRRVQVHKFIVRGTLEERIDEMIEQKTALAENIIGAGERWLTELSTDQLRDLLTLRREAVGDEI